MLMTFEGISKDSYLTMRLSAPLMDMLFPDEQTLDLEHLEDKLVLFVDGIPPKDYEVAVDGNDNIVTIGLPIPAESQELEIIRHNH